MEAYGHHLSSLSETLPCTDPFEGTWRNLLLFPLLCVLLVRCVWDNPDIEAVRGCLVRQAVCWTCCLLDRLSVETGCPVRQAVR